METDDEHSSDTFVGSVFADRYRLTRQLSAGANTLIFDADDLQSQRPVTLKVVQPGLGVSHDFRDRFDATIREVAALSHPNIAAIFDWGTAKLGPDPTVFVVTELLTAGSLRDLYDRGRRLSPSQALAVGLDACRGLDHAHRRGLVHSELTPSKLVFGDDRRLRIVDFGLARLLGERQWEDPSSLSTHVARYASPEQALSLPIDGTTDVYALCLSLVEGVTGELPFSAESTVATLAARVGRLMPVSADLGPLAAVLERAGRPEAHERSSAAQFGRSLVQAAEKLPRPEPLPLLSTGLFETPPEQLRDPDDPTGGVTRPPELVITISDDEPENDQPDDDEPAAEAADAVDDAEVPDIAERSDEVLLDLDEAAPPAPAPTPVPEAPEATTPVDIVVLDVDDPGPTGPTPPGAPPPVAVVDEPRRRGRVAVVVVPLVVLAALAGLVFLAVQLFATPSFDVPDLVGDEQSAALAEIADFEWDLQIDLERSDDEPRAGHVIRTVPAAGERLARGEPFLLVVSEGPVLRELPELRDRSVVDAVATLEALDLVAVTEQRFDEVVPADRVIEWSVVDDPDLVAGAEVEPGTEVLVVGSLGPEPRIVPDLAGADLPTVVTELANLGLVLAGPEEDFDDDVPVGLVIAQDPAPGDEVDRGSEVTVTISLGPDVVPMPDLSGLTFPEAEELLEETGLVANLVFGASDGEFVEATLDGEPVPVGELLPRGTEIDVTFL